ncbi:MAG: nuclease-like protein [Chromatiaceae bacterium]|jgi:endonuclease YncB( thermonuclease family)
MPRTNTALASALLVLLALLAGSSRAANEIVGLAIVQGDGSLLIKNRVIHLYGIYVPPTDRECRAWISPVRCSSRASLALDFRVSGFIRCYPQYENADGSLSAICYVDRTTFDPGEDLAAYLIQQGWALATPDAPFEYQALERIAENQGRGVWGFSVDTITRRPFPEHRRGHRD